MSCNYKNVHTPIEWQKNCELELKTAEKQQELAQRLILEADRLINQAKEAVVKNKLETEHQAKVKVNDVVYKCNEIEKKKFELEEEIELLLNYQRRIEKAKKCLIGDSLDVIAECLKSRKQRECIDLVFDDVEKELLKERELILGIKDQLEELLDKVLLQIRKLRPFAYNLAEDLHLKQNTLKIEEHNEQLNEKCSVLDTKNVFKPAMISMIEWDCFTSDIITKADKVLVDGRPIRAFFDKCLNKMTEDLKVQSDIVNQAIRLRVDEYEQMVENLNKQKTETIDKINQVQITIDNLVKAVDDKQSHLAIAHTRLLNRTRREGIELCRDEVEVQLYDEVLELENNVKGLKKMIAESVECLRRLKQVSTRIDIQLQIKKNSLRIDNELCFEQRKRVNYSFY